MEAEMMKMMTVLSIMIRNVGSTLSMHKEGKRLVLQKIHNNFLERDAWRTVLGNVN